MQTVLICHNDKAYAENLQRLLEEKGFDVDAINDAAELVPTGIRIHPAVIIVNPDMKGFNDKDICKHLMQDQGIEVILVMEPHSTTRAIVGDCNIEDVINRDTEINIVANLLTKNITVHQ